MSARPAVLPQPGTMVIRDGRIALASEGAAALLARTPESLLGLPFAELLAPEDRARLLDRHQRRLRGEPVPDEYEAVVLRGDGSRLAVELHVDTEGRDVVVRYRDVSASAARRPRLLALASLGAAIQRERSEAEVFERLRTALPGVGLAPVLLRALPEGLRVEWINVPEEVAAAFVAVVGRPLVGFMGPWEAYAHAAWDQGAAFTDEWAAETGAFVPAAHSTYTRALAADHGLTRAVAVRLDERSGARFCLVLAGTWLRAEDVPAVRLFGAQVAAALDAARTIADLFRHNADLAALNRLGELAGEASELDGFLQRAGAVVRGATGCEGIAVYVLDEEDGWLARRYDSAAPGPGGLRIPLAGTVGAVVRDRTPLVAPCDAGPGAGPAALGVAWVPLVARNEVVGAMAARFAGGPDRARARLDLLVSMGAHFAAAIESHGLLSDLRRRLSDLEAVHALVARVSASAPGDVAGLLEDGCAEAARALACHSAAVLLVEDEGKMLRGVAATGAAPPAAQIGIPLDRDGLAAQALRTGSLQWSEDVTRDPRSAMHGREVPFPSMLAVPLVSRAARRGVLFLADVAGRTFPAAERALAATLAGELAVGLENAELYAAARTQVERLSELNELARAASGSLEPDEVLAVGVAAARRLLGASRAFALLQGPEGSELRVAASAGTDELSLGQRVSLEQDGVAARVLRDRRPVVVDDAQGEPGLHPDYRRSGVRALVAAPMLGRGGPLGVLLADDLRPRRFTGAERERLTAVANQLAAAFENARLYADLRQSYARLAQAQRQLVERERLAALGELAAVVAHEVRNPLGVVFNSLASLRRLLRPEGDALMLLDIMGEEADRLNRIVGDLLDFARPNTPVLRPGPLDPVVDEAVAAALGDGAARVELAREAAPDLPPVAMDAHLVRRAVLNVAANAIQAMPRGGRLAVRTRRDGDGVVVELEDSGPGIPDEVRARIFEPFFTTKASGTGLGLAVVKRIVEGHGGEIAVESRPGTGTLFRLRFPAAPPDAGLVDPRPGKG